MTDPTTLSNRALLIEALNSPQDADTAPPDLHTMFTPSSHREALAPDVTVVRGARGTGKTFWAKALTDPVLRDVAARSYFMPRLGQTEVITAFGLEGGDEPVFPGKRAIASLVRHFGADDDDLQPKDLWSAVVLTALKVPQVLATDSWLERIRWTARNGELFDAALRRANRELREQGKTLILLFDRLDHLHSDRAQLDRLLGGLLEVALELRLSTNTLRAKIFVRPDMYDSAPRAFADASKLDANAADLAWSRENLYGLLFHRLGNHTSPQAEAFRAGTGTWREEEGRFIAPVEVLADQKEQERIFVTLAGPFMGSDRRKGHTYTWVPNHLQDGLGRISPRTLLSTLRKAAELTAEKWAGHPLPLHYDAIRESLSHAAGVRVRELEDDIGWAALAVGLLNGSQVPMEPSAVHYAWSSQGFTSKLGEVLAQGKGSSPRNADDPFALAAELKELGVVTYRTNGSIDLPDIYRLKFGIGRKGGVKRSPTP